jgi:hypothetical protein
LFCKFSAGVGYHLQREVLRLSWAHYIEGDTGSVSP